MINNNIIKKKENNIENIIKLTKKFGYTQININTLDYYGNSIPFGAFCHAVSFILYGFYSGYID